MNVPISDFEGFKHALEAQLEYMEQWGRVEDIAVNLTALVPDFEETYGPETRGLQKLLEEYPEYSGQILQLCNTKRFEHINLNFSRHDCIISLYKEIGQQNPAVIASINPGYSKVKIYLDRRTIEDIDRVFETPQYNADHRLNTILSEEIIECVVMPEMIGSLRFSPGYDLSFPCIEKDEHGYFLEFDMTEQRLPIAMQIEEIYAHSH